MKKVIIFAIICVMTVGVYYAIADQLISANGYHNIVGRLSLTANRICEYCHTPHRAAANMVAVVPLANTTQTNATAFCQSCHDGLAFALGDLDHTPLGSTMAGWAASVIDSRAIIATDSHIVGGINHPAGTVSGTAYGWSVDGGGAGKVNANAALRSTAYAEAALDNDGYDVDLDADNMTLHCTGCHYVHNTLNFNYRQFLRIQNTNDALCFACHNL